MRKIINGRLYDTNTAKQLTSWTGGRPGDTSFYNEELYIKRNGEYFLHGNGGPSSPYHESPELNSWVAGEDIHPIPLEEAKKVANEHLDVDEFQKVFGTVSEDGGVSTINAQVPTDLYEKLQSYVQSNLPVTKTEVITEALTKFLG